MIEIARNVLGIEDADHAETNPGAKRPVIAPLVCSLVGQEQPVEIQSGTRAATLYRTATPTEPYYCNYGLNPAYEAHLADAGVVVSGRGPGGEVRIIELPSHPFFIGTLFVPRLRLAHGKPHPIYAGLNEAVRKRRLRSEAVR